MSSGRAEPVSKIYYSAAGGPVGFGVAEIRRAFASVAMRLSEHALKDYPGLEASMAIAIATGPEQIRELGRHVQTDLPTPSAPQAYSIRVPAGGGKRILVLGADEVGAMYGALEVAEAMRQKRLHTLSGSDHRPHVVRRGIKFNIPLDLRTPSYSDCSDSFQANIPEMWSFDFWREFLDEMARHRFNVLTLWSLHPFPSLVRVPEYPEVALNDVWRTKVPLDDSFSHSGSDMVRPAMLADYEVVKRISIREKIQFWRDVMEHARNRGIEVYLFTWNTFTFGATGKYGITPALTNLTTIDYFRASVRETVLTYPLLRGMGITAGEQMENRKDEFAKEKWLWRTYGEGIRDALKVQPGREFRLIHRYHMAGQGEILREWTNYPGTMDFSFKYAIAHMYSITNPPFIRAALPAIPDEKRTWLTIRNDDIYSFRWGNPVFARHFIQNLPGPDKLAGFYMGPDGYCWGREFISTEPETPRELVMKKQWFSFMLWGRLSYEPSLPDDVFERAVAERFPEVPAQALLVAWSAASMVFPQITRLFWGDIDLRWFPEACLSHPRHRGFYTVRHFIEGETMPGSGILNIRQWREGKLKGQALEGLTPLEVADMLAGSCRQTLAALPQLRQAAAERGGAPKELRLTLGDLEAMAHLGSYYEQKICGATELALFDVNGKPEHRSAAIRHLEEALGHWREYARSATRQYRPQLLNRVGHVDLNALTDKVAADVDLAKSWKPGTVPHKAGAVHADRPFQP